MQLAEKEAFITGLQEEMRQSRSTCSDQQKEIEEVKSARDTLIKDLDEAKLRLEQETRDRAAAKSTIDRLNQQLLEIDYLREQADCVPRLVHDLEIKGRTIVNLQQEVGLLKATTEQFKGHHLDAERKTTEIAELNQKLLTANEAVQQIPVLEEKLSEYKEEIQSLKDAHERVRSLESGMIQKNEHIGQLNIKLTDLDKTLAQLNNTEAEMNRWKNDYESMKAKFEATEEEAARTGMLEEELAAKEDEIGKLRTKLTEAETISNVIPEMQEKMDQFCEAFKKLRSELEEAQQAKEELESTKAKNATLQKTVAELCEKTAMAQQTSNPMECLGLEIRQRDAQIAELRERLAHLEVESQPRNPVGDQDAENLQQGLSPQADHLVASLVQQGSVRQDNAQPVVDESEIVSTVQEAEPRRRRKRADRSASGQQAKVNVTDHEMSATKTLEGTGSALDAVHKTVTEQADQGQALVAQQLDETDVVPESQPRTKDLLKSPNAKEQVGAVEDAPLTSSPLSDIGDIFDSPNRGQPGHSQRSGPQEQDDENGEPVLGDGMASQLLLGPEEQLSKSTDSTHRVEGPSQERRLPSSSYGDSLLLDDLAGLGSWPVSPGSHGARSRRSTRGTQEVLTSPAGVMPAKQSRLSTRPRLTTTSFSRTDIKASDRFQHGRDAAEDTSPSRLRRTKRASQNDQVEMRADTPSISIKEKHQPNSAIKRKAEAAGIFDEIMSPEKKSARKNLSNLETAGRPGTRSRSLSSSIPGKNKQSLSGFKQSSVSSTTRRSGIIGKNAPTSGAGKQGSKKPKGSSRSEESVIITIKRGY